MSGTDIETLGDHPFTLEILPEFDWVHIEADGRSLNCTWDHPLFHAVRGKIKAEEVAEGDFLIMDNGEREVTKADWLHQQCSKYKVVMADGHLYFANGFLSHNFKPVNPGP